MFWVTFQTVFQRYEIKYLFDNACAARIFGGMLPFMEEDAYGETTIRNLYFDTGDFRLIRTSIDKPVYKEKLRLRSYKQAVGGDTVFAELKKKYRSVVFKRRLPLTADAAEDWLCGAGEPPRDTQIAREIEAVRAFYGELSPKVFLSYDRKAFYSKTDPSLRVTFDRNVRFRTDDLTLGGDASGRLILPDGLVLMEVKCAGGMPLWLTHLLASERLYKTPFSKYGMAYQMINKGEMIYV